MPHALEFPNGGFWQVYLTNVPTGTYHYIIEAESSVGSGDWTQVFAGKVTGPMSQVYLGQITKRSIRLKYTLLEGSPCEASDWNYMFERETSSSSEGVRWSYVISGWPNVNATVSIYGVLASGNELFVAAVNGTQRSYTQETYLDYVSFYATQGTNTYPCSFTRTEI